MKAYLFLFSFLLVTNSFAAMNFYLFDEDTRKVVAKVENGDTLDLSKYSGRKLNISVVSDQRVESARFVLGPDKTRIENLVPFTFYREGDLTLEGLSGNVTVDVTTFSEKKGEGEITDQDSLSFFVTGVVAEIPGNFYLYDEVKDEVIKVLSSGDLIDFNNYQGRNLNISYIPRVSGDFVGFEMNELSRKERLVPYTLFREDDQGSANFSNGSFHVTATSYRYEELEEGEEGEGQTPVDTSSLYFKVIGAKDAPVSNKGVFFLYDELNDRVIRPLAQGESVDVRAFGEHVNISYGPIGSVDRVYLGFGPEQMRRERVAPYTLYREDDLGTANFPIGPMTIIAQESRGEGEFEEVTVQRQISIIIK